MILFVQKVKPIHLALMIAIIHSAVMALVILLMVKTHLTAMKIVNLFVVIMCVMKVKILVIVAMIVNQHVEMGFMIM